MKMVKKCLIAIAVVALFASTVQAVTVNGANKFEGTWPWTKTYKEVQICTFPVILVVGHYVQVVNCGDLEMRLEQVNCESIDKNDDDHFPCYGDVDDSQEHGPACVDIEVRSNFDAEFGASFDGELGDVNIIGGHSLSWPNGKIVLAGEETTLKLCMTAWSVRLWESGGTDGTKKVGMITLDVKPETETGGDWGSW
jgi:hypothetical protein